MEFIESLVDDGRFRDAAYASTVLSELRAEKFGDAHPSTVESRRMVAHLCMSVDELEIAQNACEHLLAVLGEDPATLTRLSDISIKRRDFSKAATMAARAWASSRVLFETSSAIPIYMLGRAVAVDLLATGDYDAAIPMLRAVSADLRARCGAFCRWTVHMEGALRCALMDSNRCWLPGCWSTKTKKCGRCFKARYCGIEHQRRHWYLHGKVCNQCTS